MKLFIDTANIDHIKEIHDWGILSGVTTNPSLVAREGGDFIEMIYQICELVKGPVSAEVVAQDAEGMVREGRLLSQISKHVVIKLPLLPAGLQACARLSAEGLRTNLTLAFQPSQALLAALSGATYVSPFVGRVDDISWDGNELIRQIVDIFEADATIETQVLAASIRHPMHLIEAALAGAQVATVPYGVIKKSIKHPLTDTGNEHFLADWATVGDTDISAQVQRWLARRG